ncbi:hybrid sensor histidine kinase/response regulator [Marinomonas ostreistagni]|uniref:histidine kinase n=1 Tax=Marinomonas ostreistagni TaxID=359209 RepID=A0ABS0ZG20_9GAMM|nr:hybrid sensor histidine kinase/response regulator [Marinomonas ostreistagni]MBJ7552609.1 response regulator [Marinomonas ostreistagni]
MIWIFSALIIGYTSIYAAFRELSSGITISTFYRTLRGSIALVSGVSCTELIFHNIYFDHESHITNILPILIWYASAFVMSFLVVFRFNSISNEHCNLLNIHSALVSLLVITLNLSTLESEGLSALTALRSPMFWLWSIITFSIITFAFYACKLVSRVLKRPSMLDYRYFTRPIMLVFCIIIIQILSDYLYSPMSTYKNLENHYLNISKEQFLISIIIISSLISSFLLGSNFYSRYLGSEIKYIQELHYSRPSSHTFWQAFIALLALSFLILSLVFWLQWSASLKQSQRVSEVTVRNAIIGIHKEIEQVVHDIQSVKKSFLIDPNALIYSTSYREKFQSFFEGYSLSSERYDYISVLNHEGDEVARLDNNRSTPIFSAGKHFGDIDYTLEKGLGSSLERNEFFVSHVSLAHIKNKPTMPLTPILKVGAPIFNSEDKNIGLLIFTYRFERIASLLKQYFPNNKNIFLLNEANRVLLHLDKEDHWDHLLSSSNFRFLELEKSTLAQGEVYSEKRQSHILYSAAFPKSIEHSPHSYIPTWHLAIKTDYPKISLTVWDQVIIIFLLTSAFFLAKLISRSVLSDITNKRKISELLNEVGYQKQALDEHAIVSITDQRGNITYVNDKFCEISGYEPSELIGENHRILKSDEHPPAFFRTLWRTISSGQIWSGEIKNFRKNGSIYWVNATILPIKGVTGKVERYIAVRTDITESRAMATILENALKDAHQASEAKNRFLANISHEIRTPMNAIIGLTEACLISPNKSNQQELMQKVNTSANSLLRIINDILDFSKMEAGKLDIEEIPFSLEHVIDEHALIHQSVAKSKHIHLLTGIDSNVPEHLIGDPLRIGQVLSNLVSNALKFTSSGEVIVYVKVIHTKGEFVELEFSVNDTGNGMSDDQVAKLFSPFSQADVSTTRKFGGTGLGLSICKSLVELMGGQISAESQLNKGSIFRFTLPLKVNKNEPENIPNKVRGELVKSRILLIDFVGISRQNYIRYAKAFQMQLDVCSTHLEAKKLLQSDINYDYIIVDSYYISSELEALLSSLNHIAAAQNLSSLILVDYEENDTGYQAWHTSVKLLSPPISQSSLLDCMSSTNRESHSASTWNTLENVQSINIADPSALAQVKVLIVEDNEINQLVISEIFKQWLIPFVLANNGQEAIHAVQQDHFDLILMDIQMPIMDGYDACKEIRALGENYKNLPIIALTANTSAQDIQKAIKSGMDDHVSKPINRQQLQDVILKYVNLNGSPVNTGAPNEITSEKLTQRMLNALPNVDVQGSLNRLGVEPQFYLKLLSSFSLTATTNIEKARNAILEDSQEELSHIFHTLKGVAGNLGATSLYKQAQTLEQDTISGQFTQEAFETFAQEAMAICKTIAFLCTSEDTSENNLSTSTSTPHTLSLSSCQDLLALVDAFDTKANGSVRALVNAQAGTDIHKDLAQVESLLNRYDFDEAANVLRKIMDTLL